MADFEHKSKYVGNSLAFQNMKICLPLDKISDDRIQAYFWEDNDRSMSLSTNSYVNTLTNYFPLKIIVIYKIH